ncbi:MAG: DUF6627 family protein [Halofilum sp. (in: g-proteobacteria)]
MTHRSARQRFGAICCALMLLFVATAPAHAGMVGTDEVLGTVEAKDQRAELVALMERDDVRAQLVVYGLDPADAEMRIRNMTDAEVARLHGRIDELPAGSASVVGAALVVFIVFVVTDVIGATDIFPFIHPVK